MAYFSRTLLTTLVLLTSTGVVAQDVPVIELGEAPARNTVRALPSQPAVDGVPELTIQATDSGTQSSYGRNSNSDMIVLLQQLQDEVRNLRGQLESQTRKIQRMEEQQRDRYRDLDRRISYLMSDSTGKSTARPVSRRPAVDAGVSSASVPETAASSASAIPPAVASTASKPSVAKSASASGDDLKAYQSAFALVRKRAYDEAVVAFTAFTTDFPDSERVANAHYWLGEIYLAQQQLEKSRDAFSQVVALFAGHRKAADAAYKLGKVYYELGDKAKSAEYLDLVLKNYPKSSAARLARDFKPQ